MTYNKKSFGPVFRFILWLLLLFVICLVGISNVFGLETKTIYSNQTLDNSNQFNYGFVNAGGVDSITTGSVGSRISGKTKYINFYLSQNVALNYTYTIRINFLADDLQPYFSLNHVREISVCNSSSCSASSLVSIKKQNNNGFSTWVELTFNPTQIGNVIGVTLSDNSGSYITGETFFGISSVQIESKNANQDVIDNVTNNTNNIINNNNSNTESIINNNNENTQQIIDQFNSCRDSYNLFNINSTHIDYNATSVITDNLLKISTTGAYGRTDFTNIQISNNTYTLSFNWSSNTSLSGTDARVYVYDGSNVGTLLTYSNLVGSSGKSSLTFTNTLGAISIRFSPNNTGTSKTVTIDFTNIQIQKGSTATEYEPFGEQICTNKLDEQNKTSKSILGKIGDILSYLNPFSENFFAYKLVELIINGLKSLFIPKNLDFLENFKDTMSDKLGFIASIPLQLIDFIIDLKDYAFSTPTSLSFPPISIFGFSFWNQMTIDITEGLSWVSGIKYVTDIICVILCVNTLRKFYNSFFGGGEN